MFAKCTNLFLISRNGFTPLMFAAINDNLDIFSLMINNGADIYAKSKLRHTALGLASNVGNSQISSALIHIQDDIDPQNKYFYIL